jgi:DNA-binding GntR family transcriptional regulator
MNHAGLDIRNLPDRLVDVLREFILSGVIEPDLPIRQDALAAEFRVSKIPLREALARLEQDGLVFSQPNRGFFVRPMSAGEVEEVYSLRLKLEPEAAAQACLIAREQDHDAARRALAAFDADASVHKSTVGALNRAFHLALVKPGGQPITMSIVARLHVLADRYVRKHLEPKGRVPRAEEEHHALLDAWIKRKDARVRKLVAEHLEGTLRDLRGVLTAELGTRLVKSGSRKSGRKTANSG